eukprot:CAMPEP_0196741980 /NCGR_PEP_ID=MMETSP1091-20130531/43678_1 /TAXON_ID=302021 /ORGANISM="Rhodomonas sp., Strain CCMP768" /LENGTH=30 /DNA_ID= /DNA_START= /DNA_END= /DNA_ORIENTATION=
MPFLALLALQVQGAAATQAGPARPRQETVS